MSMLAQTFSEQVCIPVLEANLAYTCAYTMFDTIHKFLH